MLYTRRDKAAAYLFLSRFSSQIPQNHSLSSFSFATSPRKKEKTQSLLLILYLYLQFHKKGKSDENKIKDFQQLHTYLTIATRLKRKKEK
jgi:hypothetical protein